MINSKILGQCGGFLIGGLIFSIIIWDSVAIIAATIMVVLILMGHTLYGG